MQEFYTVRRRDGGGGRWKVEVEAGSGGQGFPHESRHHPNDEGLSLGTPGKDAGATKCSGAGGTLLNSSDGFNLCPDLRFDGQAEEHVFGAEAEGLLAGVAHFGVVCGGM